MSKLSVCIFLLCIQSGLSYNTLFAQSNIMVSYRDSNWVVTPQNIAVRKVIKEFNGKTYHSKAYNLKENYYIGFGDYKDTTYSKPVGTHVEYFKNGKIKDSSFYGDDSKQIFRNVFDENETLRWEYHFDPNTKKEVSKGYDENGKEIPNYIFEKEAEFLGGLEGWRNHLVKNLKANTPIKKKAPAGTYQVVIKFIVNADGTVTQMEPETKFGYGMEEEAMRVISKSPKWMPAVQFNKPVNAYRRQPITFVVQ